MRNILVKAAIVEYRNKVEALREEPGGIPYAVALWVLLLGVAVATLVASVKFLAGFEATFPALSLACLCTLTFALGGALGGNLLRFTVYRACIPWSSALPIEAVWRRRIIMRGLQVIFGALAAASLLATCWGIAAQRDVPRDLMILPWVALAGACCGASLSFFFLMAGTDKNEDKVNVLIQRCSGSIAVRRTGWGAAAGIATRIARYLGPVSVWQCSLPRVVQNLRANAFYYLVLSGLAYAANRFQGWSWAWLVSGCAISHMVFIVACRVDMLTSPVVRTLPVHYGRLFGRILQFPILLSALPVILSILFSTFLNGFSAGHISLAFLAAAAFNAIYFTCAVLSPYSRVKAHLLYMIVLMLGATAAQIMGPAVLLLLPIFLVLGITQALSRLRHA